MYGYLSGPQLATLGYPVPLLYEAWNGILSLGSVATQVRGLRETSSLEPRPRATSLVYPPHCDRSPVFPALGVGLWPLCGWLICELMEVRGKR